MRISSFQATSLRPIALSAGSSHGVPRNPVVRWFPLAAILSTNMAARPSSIISSGTKPMPSAMAYPVWLVAPDTEPSAVMNRAAKVSRICLASWS